MENNRLNNIGKPSFTVPEGYFSDLRHRLGEIPSSRTEISFAKRAKPYFVMAACFIISLVIGTGILKMTSGSSISETDRLYYELGYADMIPVTIQDPSLFTDEEETTYTPEEEYLNNYLIATGISIENLKYLSTYNEE